MNREKSFEISEKHIIEKEVWFLSLLFLFLRKTRKRSELNIDSKTTSLCNNEIQDLARFLIVHFFIYVYIDEQRGNTDSLPRGDYLNSLLTKLNANSNLYLITPRGIKLGKYMFGE